MVNAVTAGYTEEGYGENEDWTGEEDWTDWTGPEWGDEWSWTDWTVWTDDWSSIPLDRPSTVQITDLESGVVTGGTGRQIRTGTPGPGLLGTFIGTVTVSSLFGNSPETPISPVTLENTYKSTVPYFDSLSKIHDDCFFSIPVQGDWILFDSGASANRCPTNYATEYPLLPVGENVPKLKSATGEPLEIHGRRVIHYNWNEVKLFINYYV